MKVPIGRPLRIQGYQKLRKMKADWYYRNGQAWWRTGSTKPNTIPGGWFF